VGNAATLTFQGAHIERISATMPSYWSNGDNACVSVDDEPPQSTTTISQSPDSTGPARVLITADDQPLDRMANSDQDVSPSS
jgi:hypothetical protein